MILELKLDNAYGKYNERTATIIKNEQLFISLQFDKNKNTNYIAFISNGSDTLTKRIDADNIIEIPAEFTNKSCVINLTIQELSKEGITVSEFICESLIVKIAKADTLIIPVVEDLTQRVERMEKALTEFYNIIKNKGDLGI